MVTKVFHNWGLQTTRSPCQPMARVQERQICRLPGSQKIPAHTASMCYTEWPGVLYCINLKQSRPTKQEHFSATTIHEEQHRTSSGNSTLKCGIHQVDGMSGLVVPFIYVYSCEVPLVLQGNSCSPGSAVRFACLANLQENVLLILWEQLGCSLTW